MGRGGSGRRFKGLRGLRYFKTEKTCAAAPFLLLERSFLDAEPWQQHFPIGHIRPHMLAHKRNQRQVIQKQLHRAIFVDKRRDDTDAKTAKYIVRKRNIPR